MFTKRSVLFLLVCLFITEYGAAEIISPKHFDLQAQEYAAAEIITSRAADLKTQVNLAKAKLIADGQKMVKDANNNARTLSEQVQKYGSERFWSTQKYLTDLEEKNNKTLTQQVSQTGGLITKITNCTRRYETELQEYGMSAFRNITGCVTERIYRGIAVVQNIIGASITITNILTTLPTRITVGCPLERDTPLDRIGQLICTLSVIGAAGFEIATQGIIISANVAEATALIASLATIQVDLPACLTARSLAAATRFLVVILPIVGCTLT